jgi:hypothetical protein
MRRRHRCRPMHLRRSSAVSCQFVQAAVSQERCPRGGWQCWRADTHSACVSIALRQQKKFVDDQGSIARQLPLRHSLHVPLPKCSSCAPKSQRQLGMRRSVPQPARAWSSQPSASRLCLHCANACLLATPRHHERERNGCSLLLLSRLAVSSGSRRATQRLHHVLLHPRRTVARAEWAMLAGQYSCQPPAKTQDSGQGRQDRTG